MSDRDIKNRWINAGIIIGNDYYAKVLCPVCQKAYLQVTDVKSSPLANELIARLMTCSECGAFNELRLHRTIEN